MSKPTTKRTVTVSILLLAAVPFFYFILQLKQPDLPQKNHFFTTKNNRFQRYNQNYFVYSANYWQAIHVALQNKTRFLLDLDHLQSIRVNNIRIMASGEGPDDEPFRIRPSLMVSPGVYQTQVLDSLDFVLSEISKRGMSVVMCLNNQWHWSGGFAQYVSWVTGTKIPYPSSWDNAQQDFTNAPLEPFLEYANRFYNDQNLYSQTQKLFLDHISFMLHRVNPYTRVEYRNEPMIFAWEIANEPQFPSQSWVQDVSRFIKRHDRNHMVTVGLESRFDLNEFLTAHQVPEIDYCTVHIWAQNRGIYNMTDSSEQNISQAIQWALGWINKVSHWASIVGKPLVLEEFGMPRDNFGSKKNWYSPLNPTTRRDRYFEALVNKVVDHYLNKESFAGVLFFNVVRVLEL
jgi:mannan endo-1,4-beta-mannosidase